MILTEINLKTSPDYKYYRREYMAGLQIRPVLIMPRGVPTVTAGVERARVKL
jgi:hypothetical protein